jgi:hypothetical protein
MVDYCCSGTRGTVEDYSSINEDRSNNGAIRFIAQDPGMYVSYKSYSYICPTDIFGINFKTATEYYRCYIS